MSFSLYPRIERRRVVARSMEALLETPVSCCWADTPSEPLRNYHTLFLSKPTCLTANNCAGFDRALVRTGRVDRLLVFEEPKEPEILQALRRLTDAREDREERFAFFCSKLKKVKRTPYCMASLVDFLFRHPTTYVEDFEELLESCADHFALTEEDKVCMFS